MNTNNRMRKSYKEKYTDFDSLKLTLASPEQILEWSYGEVTKAETINYRTFRAEPQGLFCEEIFGPTKSYECYCGKYKKIRYKGIVCDKCSVEVTDKSVRRERMGHINLAVPVAHVWYAFGIPNKMAIVLDMPHKKLLSVVYYTRYMVVDVQTEKRNEIKEKLLNFLNDEKAAVVSELDAALVESEKEFAASIDKLAESEKNPETLSFKKNQLQHKHNKVTAEIRKSFADKEGSIEEFYGKLADVVNKIEVGSVLTEDEYIDLTDRDLIFFEAKMGAEAIKHLLEKLDLNGEITLLRHQSKQEKGNKKLKLIKRLQYLEGFMKNNLRPSWMVLNVIPVIPPELRPIIPLPGGKFATSDLNDLYRRIINRNNRLAKLIDIGAPDVILRNEKRMLQESVDALLDNQHRPSKAMLNNKKLPYRSLTDELRGKKGIFRRNLLGKRVDYSGRAVIVGDARLRLHQCGLPKSIALEMFKPFVIHELMEAGLAPNVRVAKEMIEAEDVSVWDILEKIIKNRPVLLNRAPTLHKYSIQAFYPTLVSGEAIRIHPLVCKAFNADFDGDQMAVHVLLTDEAVQEGIDKMLSTKNIISIADGKVLANPAKEMVLGFFMLTDLNADQKHRYFGTFDDAMKAFYRGDITVNEEIVVKGKGKVWNTSVGRVIFNSVLPEDYPFVNERIGGSEASSLISDIKDKYSVETVYEVLDRLKDLGFKYATDLAFSFAMEDCNLNIDIHNRIEDMDQKDHLLQENYLQGLITEKERVNLTTTMWNDFADQLADEVWKSLDKNNSVYEMVTSGANGSKIQARQILTIRGVVRDSAGNWVPLPIKGNYRDGLSGFEYFVGTKAGRKGVADTALRTAKSGYLTRKLADVGHPLIIRMDDCGYVGDGHKMSRSSARRMNYAARIYGRVVAQDVVDKEGKVIVAKNEAITRHIAMEIDQAGIDNVSVRTPILCQAPLGLCKNCYGFDIEKNAMVDMGKAVGIIAAQSIGEPSTQMTMQTFHTGGVMRTDITQGLPRIEELFEARTPKMEAEIAKIDGEVKVDVAEDESATITITGSKTMIRHYILSNAKKINVEDGAKVASGQSMYIDADEMERQAPFTGIVKLDHGILTVTGEVDAEEVITSLPGIQVLVKTGDKVTAGQQLTEGSIDPKKLAEVASLQKAQEYVLDGIQQVFNEQGVSIADIHIEVITRQMATLGRVMDSGQTDYVVGTLVNRFIAQVKNDIMRKEDKDVALVVPKLLGIKAAALSTESFLSAMSFQEQVKGLTSASILGKVDYLRGMKENVMIGRRVPSGFDAMIQNIEELDEIKM